MSDQAVQWEYRIQTVGSGITGAHDEQIEEILNDWGQEGWEAVNVYSPSQSPKVTLVAKRPLSATARRFNSMP
jgi:hypothetical protein